MKFLTYSGGVNMATDRPDPEKLLARLKAKEERDGRTRGKFRIYLGAAPGAGKTYAMLGEGRRRKERGTDVVIGYVETHNRPLTIQMTAGLEVVPRRVLAYRDRQMEEMDVDAVIARAPKVALVDELAHTNVPGSRHEKRWQDVLAIRDAGITVITTVNVQHLESLRDRVEQITGITVRETVPDWVIDAADEVEMVDIAPEALQSRMRHGNIYPPERAQAALQSFFRIGNLQALRDMALRRTMQEVDGQLEQYMREHDLDDWRPEERVLVCFDHRHISDTLMRRAARMARGMRAQLYALYIKDDAAEKERAALDAHVKLAESLEAEVVQVEAEDPVAAIARFVAEQRITQVVIGHTQRSRWYELLHGSLVNRLLRALPDTDIHVITARPGDPEH